MIIAIDGPSGAGKGTLIKGVLSRFPELGRSANIKLDTGAEKASVERIQTHLIHIEPAKCRVRDLVVDRRMTADDGRHTVHAWGDVYLRRDDPGPDHRHLFRPLRALLGGRRGGGMEDQHPGHVAILVPGRYVREAGGFG